ncbi:hypothetical protein DL766_003086 [Monosporascus sp. MC13-8B]|uniref:Uncharacterized protein n=1 Tax=Monosporascus cannonballus TaxID=155416 RepID=A0ABY0GRN8_9PEZI|nr:hypothetical protein DL762_010159 [Monosporascus cannonballus]RYO76654.1 hypothetical protein DL763_010279 [Monosporascus cannonballus]RYP34269.1 hypothetical protein DL766_003086 [Monosporascus sp. MC13-8B]
MQFSIPFATLVSLATVDAFGAAIERRQNKIEPVGIIGVFNNARCQQPTIETFMIQNVGDCITFDQGYGSAYLSPAHSLGTHFLVTFKGENCSGGIQVAPPSTCAENLGDEAIWSVGATYTPPLPPITT